jgi:hypothetical protein
MLGKGTFGIVYSEKSVNQYAIMRNLVEDNTSLTGVIREIDVLSELRSYPPISPSIRKIS